MCPLSLLFLRPSWTLRRRRPIASLMAANDTSVPNRQHLCARFAIIHYCCFYNAFHWRLHVDGPRHTHTHGHIYSIITVNFCVNFIFRRFGWFNPTYTAVFLDLTPGDRFSSSSRSRRRLAEERRTLPTCFPAKCQIFNKLHNNCDNGNTQYVIATNATAAQTTTAITMCVILSIAWKAQNFCNSFSKHFCKQTTNDSCSNTFLTLHTFHCEWRSLSPTLSVNCTCNLTFALTVRRKCNPNWRARVCTSLRPF